MKKTFARHVLAAGLFIAGSSHVSIAGPLGSVGTFTLTRIEGFRAGPGGEFTVYNIQSLPGQPPTVVDNSAYSATAPTKDVVPAFPSSFQTFCLELTENAALDGTNYFVVGSSAAAGGGGSSRDANGAINGRDQISKGTAWLYSQFAQGLLNVPKVLGPDKPRGDYFSNASTTPPRYAEAEMLQKAIWWLEQEGAPSQDILDTNPYYLKAIEVFAGEAGGAKADAEAGYLGVYVLNNFKTLSALNTYRSTGDIYATPTTERAQDFLWYDETSVPDGGTTVMLLGGALACLGFLRRRIKH